MSDAPLRIAYAGTILVEDVFGDDVAQFSFRPDDHGGTAEEIECSTPITNGTALRDLRDEVEYDLAVRADPARAADGLHARK